MTAMSDERKVPCPCGSEMQFCGGQRASLSGEFTWFGQYVCKCGWRAPYREGETQEGCKQNAYLAVTRRPPNKPLTESALMALNPASDAVWYVIDGWTEQSQVISAHSAQSEPSYWLSADMLLFAAKPSPADIEAARKESANGTY